MSRCRGCGAEIEWIKTPAGKNMPIDPEPVFVLAAEDGKGVFLTDEGEMFYGQAVESGEGAEVGFVPHWATCRADNPSVSPTVSRLRGGGVRAPRPTTGQEAAQQRRRG